MRTRVIDSDNNSLTLQVVVDTGSCRELVDFEEAIQKALNEAGTLATAAALKRFDADGQPLQRDGRRFTSKGEVIKQYETPYGTADVARHIYQHSGGGATYCPLDERAGLVLSATPKFARMIASKFAEFGSARVQSDMVENHGRSFSRGYVAKLAEAVAAMAESRTEQEIYRLPDLDAPTETLVVAVDEVDITAFRPNPATVATASIGLYDRQGERQYVVYLADVIQAEGDSREANPDRFLGRLRKELERARQKLEGGDPRTGDPGDVPRPSDRSGPGAGPGTIVGISGGQPWSDKILGDLATVQFIDPAKVEERLAEAAAIYFQRAWKPDREGGEPEDLGGRRQWEQRNWVEGVRDRIRSREGSATVLGELERWSGEMPDDPGQEVISGVMAFLARERDSGRLNYEDPRASHAFANKGILADSAKVIFGDRIDHPKFKIGLGAAKAILILRELTRTPGRWDQFWDGVRGKDRDRERFEPGDRRG